MLPYQLTKLWASASVSKTSEAEPKGILSNAVFTVTGHLWIFTGTRLAFVGSRMLWDVYGRL